MLRQLSVLGAALCGLVVYACGSSTSVKRVPGSSGTGGEAGEAPVAGGSAGRAGSGGKSANGDAGEGGSKETAGATSAAGEAGASGAEAGASGAEAGAAGSGPECSEDGAVCATGDGAGVCCSGACVNGDCCGADDCATGSLCTNHQCVNVAGGLSGLLWQLPCTGDVSSVSCNAAPNATVSTTLGGASGVTYDVTLHFRGIVEQKTYAGGCSDGAYWLTAGASNGDSYNVYRLDVSSPPQTFYLNRGTSSITNVWALDYTKTVRIDAGATVTLYADTVDNQEIKNLDAGGTPISISDVSVTQPYNGQFIQMDVENVSPDAVASNTTVGGGSAGSALSFTGSQLVTIADAASLEPGDLTQEAWFNFGGTTDVYSTIFGKTYGGGSQDSYTIWFQGGVINAAVAASSPSGATSVPWTALNEWHHAAFSYDSSSQIQTLYIDGLPAACLPASGQVSYDTHALLLGADVDNGSTNGFWNGALDEVRLFSSVRTPAQIWADMHTHSLGPTTSLVGEWTFDEGSGQTVGDSSGKANVGVLGTSASVEAGDPAWISSTVPH